MPITATSAGISGIIVALQPAWAVPIGVALATAALVRDLLHRSERYGTEPIRPPDQPQ